MTPEVKQRIEQIRCGEVPEGYKKTKIGVVPNEWDVTKLSAISSHVTRKNTDEKVLITFTNSATKGVIKQTDYFDKEISNKENISGYYLVEEDDYIYNPRISVSAPCGPINKSHFAEKGVVSPLYTVFKMNEAMRKNNYIEYYLKSSFWHRYMSGVANYGARHDRMNITNDDLFAMPIPFPSLPEQEKIAKILSAQDKLVALKEKLVEEKKRQKKALMQQLLTGKKRLAGFNVKWKKKRVADIATLITDSINPCDHSDELFDVYSLPAFDNNRNPEHLSGAEMNSNKFVVTQGMILFNKLNVRQKRVWYVESKSPQRMLSSTEFLPLKIKSENPKFLTQYFLTDKVTRYFIIRSSGTSNSQQRILPNDLMKHSLFIPEINEQDKIVEILETFDKGIELLQVDLDQEKQKKKALMQLLLTGVVRV